MQDARYPQLAQGAAALGLNLPEQTLQQLLAYVEQLNLWNKAYNLTAIRDPAAMLVRHVLDCLAILPHLPAGRLLDVGTGAGLPGLIVALCEPTRPCVMLDSNGKKIRFVRQIIADFNMKHAQATQARIEDEQTRAELAQFDVITNRAFARLGLIWRDCSPYLTEQGAIIAMKGQFDPTEIAELPANVGHHVIALDVPQLGEARHLILMTKQKDLS